MPFCGRPRNKSPVFGATLKPLIFGNSHVGIWYILGPQRAYHIMTLGPMFAPEWYRALHRSSRVGPIQGHWGAQAPFVWEAPLEYWNPRNHNSEQSGHRTRSWLSASLSEAFELLFIWKVA